MQYVCLNKEVSNLTLKINSTIAQIPENIEEITIYLMREPTTIFNNIPFGLKILKIYNTDNAVKNFDYNINFPTSLEEIHVDSTKFKNKLLKIPFGYKVFF